jgi:cyclase
VDNLELAHLDEVVPGVFAWIQPDGTWWVNNAGAVVADGEAVVIDTCATARRTERFLAALTEASGGAAIRTAINTHVHGDHTYGNSLLPSSTGDRRPSAHARSAPRRPAARQLPAVLVAGA